MSGGTVMMIFVTLVTFGSLGFLLFAMVRSIRNERNRRHSIWREFGLGFVLVVLFFVTWIAHGITEWQTYTDEQRGHGQEVSIGDFASEFASSTLENWQSEFLQLFSFVVLAAMYIHKGSAESKDGDEKMEAPLRRIEEKLGTLPDSAPREKSERWKLPDNPQALSRSG